MNTAQDTKAAQLARDHYRTQQTLAVAAALQAQQAWKQIDVRNISASWQSLLSLFMRFLVAFQAQAARNGSLYVGQIAEAAGSVVDPIGTVVPDALTGIASDGRDLETLLQTPLIGVFKDIGGGAPADRALQSGMADVVKITATQVSDAGRIATGLAMTNDRGIRGYVRIVRPNACGRCIILAGREYSHSTGFLRHPACTCEMRPLTAAEWDSHVPGTDPRELFERMTPEQQAKAFTVHGAQAIRDGADIGRVVNARRGLSTAAGPGGRKLRTTTEAVTRRGIGQRLGGRPRIMPEQVYAEAARLGWGREEIVGQLKRYGFIY